MFVFCSVVDSLDARSQELAGVFRSRCEFTGFAFKCFTLP